MKNQKSVLHYFRTKKSTKSFHFLNLITSPLQPDLLWLVLLPLLYLCVKALNSSACIALHLTVFFSNQCLFPEHSMTLTRRVTATISPSTLFHNPQIWPAC